MFVETTLFSYNIIIINIVHDNAGSTNRSSTKLYSNNSANALFLFLYKNNDIV